MKNFTLKVKNKIKRLSLKEGQNPKQIENFGGKNEP